MRSRNNNMLGAKQSGTLRNEGNGGGGDCLYDAGAGAEQRQSFVTAEGQSQNHKYDSSCVHHHTANIAHIMFCSFVRTFY